MATPIKPSDIHHVKASAINLEVNILIDKFNSIVKANYNPINKSAMIDITNWHLDKAILELALDSFRVNDWSITENFGDQRDPYHTVTFHAVI